jgi:hypothetical protein
MGAMQQDTAHVLTKLSASFLAHKTDLTGKHSLCTIVVILGLTLNAGANYYGRIGGELGKLPTG